MSEIPRGAAVAIDDFLDNCVEIRANEEVVIASHIDGIYGGDNLVDPVAVAWLQAAIAARGAKASILWIDEPAKMHAWKVPPVFMAALQASDVFINQSFDLTIEEFKEIMNAATDNGVRLCRNFATTPGLLTSPWAMTPYELIAEIRYQVCIPFGSGGMPYSITDERSTHLEGHIAPPNHPRYPVYTQRRKDGPGYRPFPEWVCPPINVRDSHGTIVFDRMLSWWSRYIGLPPVFREPIRLTIENNRIVKIEGGQEADALRGFLKSLEPKLGNMVYGFPEIHTGVHPNAVVSPQQCNHVLMQRVVNHSDTCNLHFHIGERRAIPEYPYGLHITGDLRTATWRVGDQLIHDRGRLTALDHPKVKEVASKYPDRPGLTPWPRNF
jgi:hypothetical protein